MNVYREHYAPCCVKRAYCVTLQELLRFQFWFILKTSNCSQLVKMWPIRWASLKEKEVVATGSVKLWQKTGTYCMLANNGSSRRDYSGSCNVGMRTMTTGQHFLITRKAKKDPNSSSLLLILKKKQKQQKQHTHTHKIRPRKRSHFKLVNNDGGWRD